MGTKTSLNEAYVKRIRNAPAFGLKDKIGYMFGDLGFNSLQVIVNSYLMLFCVNIMGVKAVHFASIVFICKLLDALNDTIIGATVDRRPASGNGKMKPYLIWFAIPYAIFTIILFANVTSMPYALRIIWILMMYFIWGIVGTFINVPYGAMSNIITTNQIERTELSNFRSIGSFLPNIAMMTIAPLILFDDKNDPIASRFIMLTIVAGIFCTICLVAAHGLISERVLVTQNDNLAGGEKINYLEVAKSFLKNRIMIAVVLAYVVSKLFTQPLAMINQYVFMVYFQDTAMLSISSLGTMVPMIIGMILIKPCVKVCGKKNLVTWPVLFSAALYGVTMLFPMTPMSWIVCQIIAAFGTTFSGLLLWSMISDAVDYQAYITGKRNDGTVYATITFIVFFAASASTSLIALVLEAIGYDASLGSMGQLAGVAERIKLFGGAWPFIGCVLVFICYKMVYNISDAEMKKISDSLRERSEKEEAEALKEMSES